MATAGRRSRERLGRKMATDEANENANAKPYVHSTYLRTKDTLARGRLIVPNARGRLCFVAGRARLGP